MKHLPCDSCGHANPLKSEYLTFCNACGKKLSQTFEAWRRSNPEASFITYSEQVGVTVKTSRSNTFPIWLKQQFQPAHRSRTILFFVFFIGLLAAAGTIFGKKAIYSFMYPKVPAGILYRSWQTVTIGRQALEITTPVKLWVHDQPLDGDEAKVIEYAKSYSNEDGGGIRIAVNMFSYMSHVANNLEEAMAQAHSTMQLKETATEIDCKSVPVLISGMQGMLEEGNYLYRGGVRFAFCNLVMIRGNSRWQIHINYRDDDQIARQVAQRVLKSVRIK
ncbi:hypothetical protein [Chitinophaga sp. 30R24]|uniref:hypothetical protein n=1 Tax=Chitinophaga sp. 30R24 TaxID=3248838 RepID=UPI003B97EA35